MIPATQPFEARYKHSTQSDRGPRTYFTTLAVVAWDKDGDPLVSNGKGLLPANSFANFHDVLPAQPPVVAVIPGGGWVVEFKDDDTVIPSPIVAWTVDAQGSVTPLSSDSTGYCEDPTGSSNFVRIYHPDEEAMAGVATPEPTEGTAS